jgi:hypothetical protein
MKRKQEKTTFHQFLTFFFLSFCVEIYSVGLLVLDDDEEDELDREVDDHISVQQQQQLYQTPPSRGTNSSSSMGRLNGRQMGGGGGGGHGPSSTGLTTLVSSSTGSTYPHRGGGGGMMMAQHVPHYQLPPTPPHHPIHPHLSSYGVQHPHHVANNSFSTKDVMDNDMLDSDPTTLLKQAPTGSKFIPAGNQTRDPIFVFFPPLFVLFLFRSAKLFRVVLLLFCGGCLLHFAHYKKKNGRMKRTR